MSEELKAAIATIDAMGMYREYDEYLAAVLGVDLNMAETWKLIFHIESKLA